MRDVTVGHRRTVEVDIANLVVIAAIDAAADVPTVQRVEADVERSAAVDAPIAVDVLRTGNASAGSLVVGHDVTDGIAGATHTGVETIAPMTLCFGNLEAQAVLHQLRSALLLEVGTQVGGERGFQSRVTHRDVERVGVVVDIEHLGDTGLRGVSAQLHLEVGLLVEAVAHIQRRRIVGHRADGVNGDAEVLLDVVRALWLDGYAEVHVQFFAHHA